MGLKIKANNRVAAYAVVQAVVHISARVWELWIYRIVVWA